MEDFLQRITLNPAVCQGKPSIRAMRFTVALMLEFLASGMTHVEILETIPPILTETISP